LESAPPGLRLLRGLGRRLPHPVAPEGDIGEGARPAPVRPETTGRSCHPSSAASEDAVLPEEQPQGRCLVPAPEGAGPSPTRGPAGGVPGAVPCRPAEAGGQARVPGHRRLIARRSSVEAWGLRRRFPSPTGVEWGMPQAACHVESCRTPLMVVSKIAPPSTHAGASTPSTLPSSTERGAHRGEHAVHRSGSRWLLHGLLRCAPSARGSHASSPVPPVPFLTTSAACSALALAGLLHPAADHGVRLVAGFRPESSRCSSRSWIRGPSPDPGASVSPEGATSMPRTVSATPSQESSEAGVHAAGVQSASTPRGVCVLHSGRHASTQPTPLLRTHPKVARCSPRPDDCSPGRAPRCRHLDCDDRGRPSPCPVVAGSVIRRWRTIDGARVDRDRSPDLRGRDVAAATRSRFRSTGSRLPPRRSLRRGALRSFPLVHSALSARFVTATVSSRAGSEEPAPESAAPCFHSRHQVTLAAASPSLLPTAVPPVTEVTDWPPTRSRPRGLLPCPSPLPSHRLRHGPARCSLGLGLAASARQLAVDPRAVRLALARRPSASRRPKTARRGSCPTGARRSLHPKVPSSEDAAVRRRPARGRWVWLDRRCFPREVPAASFLRPCR
jgi:hypothetical protein